MSMRNRIFGSALSLSVQLNDFLINLCILFQIYIAGEIDDVNTQALLDVVRSRFIPGRVLAVLDGPSGTASLLYKRHESLVRLRPISGKSTAYVCRNFACSLPVTEPEELASLLDGEKWKDTSSDEE